MKKLAIIDAPSEVIKSAHAVKELFVKEGCFIHLNQVSPAIFCPPLANLQRQLENLDMVPISPNDVEHCREYVSLAIRHYDNEKARQEAIEKIVNQVFGSGGEWVTNVPEANVKPDAIWWKDGFVIFVAELKNVIGLCGDALLQAVVDYAKIMSRPKVCVGFIIAL